MPIPLRILPLFFLFWASLTAFGQTFSGLPVPRYVSLGTDEANMRVGPGQDYAIAWIYIKPDIPFEVIAEYDNWRQVRDMEGNTGWLHSSLLSGRRMVYLTAPMNDLREDPEDQAPVVLQAEQNVLGRVRECNDQWCLIEIQRQRGWIEKDNLWGVYNKEILD